jgi:hypothetical protein
MNVNDPSQSDGDVADFKLSSKARQDNRHEVADAKPVG